MSRSRLVILVVALGAALPAAAQTPTRDKPFPEVRGARHWGPFLVDPKFVIDNIGYDDNIYLAPKDQSNRPATERIPLESDYVVRAGPDVTAQLAFGPNIMLTVHDKLSGEAYLDHSPLNSLSNAFDGQFDVLVGPALFSTKAIWQTTRWRPTSEVRERVRQRTLSGTQSVRFFLGPKVDAVASFRADEFRFTNPDLLAGYNVDIDFDGTISDDERLSIGQALDREMEEVAGEVGWRPNSRVRFFVRVSERDATFAYSTLRRDSNEQRGTAGVEFAASARVSGKIAFGIARLENKDKSLPYEPYDGGISEVQLVYRPTGRTRIKAVNERQLVFSTYQNNLYYRETTRSLAFDTYIGAAWGVTAGISRRVSAYPQPGTSGTLLGIRRRDELNDYFGGLLFRLKGGFEIGVRVGRQDRDSNELFAVDERSYITTTGSYVF